MELAQKHRDFIEKIAKENDLEGCKISLSSGSNKGDNYIGIITRIILKKGEKKLSLILKSRLTDINQNIGIPINVFFTTEINVYTLLFNEFAEFEDKYNTSNRFTAYAKFYGAIDDQALILQDLKVDNYQMWNKQNPMNSIHIEKVLKEYAKFHAISLAMNEKNPERFKELSMMFINHFEKMQEENEEGKAVFEKISNLLNKSVDDDRVAVKNLQKYEEFLMANGFKTSEPEKYRVISHGDCWCNNFLFKYQGNNLDKPESVKILDWQLSKTESPAGDLVYFIVGNGSKEVLDNYKYFLKIYHDGLREKLKEFACEIDDILTFDDLVVQFHKYCKKMLPMFTIIMRILICSPDEAPEFKNGVGNTENMNNIFSFQLTNMDEYYRRLAIIVRFMIQHNILC